MCIWAWPDFAWQGRLPIKDSLTPYYLSGNTRDSGSLARLSLFVCGSVPPGWHSLLSESAQSKGIGRQGTVLKHRSSLHKEPTTCRSAPLFVQALNSLLGSPVHSRTGPRAKEASCKLPRELAPPACVSLSSSVAPLPFRSRVRETESSFFNADTSMVWHAEVWYAMLCYTCYVILMYAMV